MSVTIRIDDQAVFASLNRTKEYLGGSALLMEIIGRQIRDYTQETVRMQGRYNPWAPPSIWTRRKHYGHSNLLPGLIDSIRYHSNKNEASVFVVNKSEDWTWDQHARGYITPARVGRPVMAWQDRNGWTFLRHARASVVPARPFMPSYDEAAEIAVKTANDWIDSGMRKSWRPGL
jgi:phage gpG-like protein